MKFIVLYRDGWYIIVKDRTGEHKFGPHRWRWMAVFRSWFI